MPYRIGVYCLAWSIFHFPSILDRGLDVLAEPWGWGPRAAPFYLVKLVRRIPGPLSLGKRKEGKPLPPALAKRIDNTHP